jgi:ATP-dependent protease ClpP protease subunit
MENPCPKLPPTPKHIAYFGGINEKMLAALYTGPDVFMLQSDGGDLHCMLAAVDYLEADQEISVRVTGSCFSATIPILACAGDRRATKNTRFLCHPMTIHGTDTDLIEGRADMREMEFLDKKYIDLLVKYTKKGKRFWEELCQKSTYFGVREAKRWGLLDRII